jgi:hypothetical protein
MQAGTYAGEMASYPITALSHGLLPRRAGNFIADHLSGVAVRLARRYARYFCGTGKKPGSHSFQTRISLPDIDTRAQKRCKSNDERPEEELAAACEDYQRQLEESKAAYRIEHGRCEGSGEARRLCEQRRQRARLECNYLDDEDILEVEWREGRRQIRYALVDDGAGERVVRTELGAEGHRRSFSRLGPLTTARPCAPSVGSRVVDGASMTPWNDDVSQPVCHSRARAPSVSTLRAAPGHELVVEEIEVTDILECQKSKTVVAALEGERIDERLREMTPQEMCNCAAQGEDLFQIRSVVTGEGETLSRHSSELLGRLFASARQLDAGALGSFAAHAGELAFAQAEFYFDDPKADVDEWLWHMKWKARLRLTHLAPSRWQCPIDGRNTCPSASDGPAAGSAALLRSLRGRLGAAFDEVVAH